MGWLKNRFAGTRHIAQPIQINGKPSELRCTGRAAAALAERIQPLLVDMNVVLGCMARKEVCFIEDIAGTPPLFMNDKLAFQVSLMIFGSACTVGAAAGDGQSSAVADRLAPRWVSLDYRKGEWVGDFEI